jgi:RNA polymerase sigma-70 factor (ECF subfamily)
MAPVAAFTDAELTGLRRGLIAFCYQMLGSPFDAEDAAHDAIERAWRARDDFDPGRASLRTWCYRIARNVCIDRIRESPRRPMPRDLQDPGLEVGAPLVPAMDVPWLMPAPTEWCAASEVERSAERSQDVRLAVTAMLQTLPPRQRGVFVLRDLLDFSADETASALEMTVASVNSALQRAREGLRARTPRRRALAAAAVERYAAAIERADAAGLAALVADDVVFEMPPVPQWSVGRDTYGAFMAHLYVSRGTDWRTRLVDANGQHGLLLFRVVDGVPQPHSVHVLDGAETGDAIGHIVVFQYPDLFPVFGDLPADR